MKRVMRSALCLLALTAVPLLAQQKKESEADQVRESTGTTEHGEPAVIWGWLNFLMLAGGLGYVVKKNVGPYFAQRSKQIRQGIAEAEDVRAEAEARIAEVEGRLANLQPEIEALRREALQEQEAEGQRMRQEAAAELAKIQARLAEEIAAAGKTARLELRRYSAEMALRLAEQKIRAQMSERIEDRLVTSFIEHLSRPAARVQST
jgi:F-type H+-transporting ATPase subunit b